MTGNHTLFPLRSWRKLPVLAAVFSCLASCEIINPDEPVPIYVQVDSIPFRITASNQGTSSVSIVDVWAFLDGKLVGGFELPARFPVLANEGSHKLTLQAGILVNGIRSTRAPYDFYLGYDTTFMCVPGQSYTLQPRTEYLPSTTFTINEDFEQSGLYFERDPLSDTILHVINDANAFEDHSGAIFLDATRPYFKYQSTPPFGWAAGSAMYAEINYKNDNEFTVGLISRVNGVDLSEPIVTIRPSDTWKKIYVSLNGALSNQPFASGYRLFITAIKAPGTGVASIYLDNIKVVQ